MKRSRTGDLASYSVHGGPLCGLTITANAEDNLLVDASNGSYWAAPYSTRYRTSDPLMRLVWIAVWNEGERFRFPGRAPLAPPSAQEGTR